MVDSSFPQQLDALPLDLQERLGDFLEQYADSVERGEPISHVSWVQEFPQLQAYIERMMLDIDALCKIPSERKSHSGVAFAPSSVTQGSVLGDFEIQQELGRGGMGVVYLAQQRSLQRRVALKMLPFAAILEPNQIARFHTEAQAAASLHHPNIVPVYSVGCERGVHYYSMQYIDGQTVEAFLDSLRQGKASQHSWTDSCSTSQAAEQVESVANGIQSTRRTSKSTQYIRQIAGKMAQVAMALNFAHSRGVIHRDIKPSNLMIDRQGNLWLTDFGLARIQDGQSVTIDGDLVGTLRYMSPEQANGQTHLVDHRADIYAFGVTLYEMLTLRYAFDGSDRLQVMAAIQRAKPVGPRSINPSIPADLETIVAKCMSPEKDERYKTAGELADDLYRFLNYQPIAARRPSVADRLGKWALRKKKWVAVAGLALLMLAIGSMAFTFFILQQRNRAEMFANNAQMIVDRFGSEFADQLEGIPGTEEVRRNILRETSEYYSQLIRYSELDSALARQAAHAAHRLASISQRLGKIEAASFAYRDALERWERYVDRHGMADEDKLAIAACHRDYAVLQSRLGDEHSARSHFESSLALLQPTATALPADARRLVELVKTRSELSLFLARIGNAKSAIDLLTQSVIDLEQSLAGETDDCRSERSAQIVFALNNHASILLDRDPGQAAILLRKAATLQADFDPANRRNLNEHMLQAIVQSNLGIAERKLGNATLAETQFQIAFDELQSILERYPDYVKAHVELAACYNNWAQLHLDNREHAKAKSCFEEARTLLVAAQIKFPSQPEIPHFLNLIQRNLGILNDSDTQAIRNENRGNSKLVSDGDDIS
jgi:serine/threonine protein kinase